MLETDLRLLVEGIAAILIAIGGFKAQGVRRNGSGRSSSRGSLMSIEAREETKNIRDQFVPRVECNREHANVSQRLLSIESGIHELLGKVK